LELIVGVFPDQDVILFSVISSWFIAASNACPFNDLSSNSTEKELSNDSVSVKTYIILWSADVPADTSVPKVVY